MRARILVAVLGGCRVAAPSKDAPTATVDDRDTDAPDADTDPIAADTDTPASDTDDDACLRSLVDTGGWTPQSWDEIPAAAEQACVATSSCDPALGASGMLSWTFGAAGSTAYFDAEGSLIAVHHFSDVGGCSAYGYGTWFGPVVAACSHHATLATESVSCAMPTDLPTPAPGCVVSWAPRVRVHDVTGWADAGALGSSYCVGLATCTLGDRQLDFVYHDNGSADGPVDVWERATGTLVANLEPETFTAACGAATHWAGEDLSACLPISFTPSEACGIAELP